MESRLAQLQLDVGLEEFRARLPMYIMLPASIEARPDPRKLVAGLRVRRWPDNLVA
jgi:hypothetical protein